MLQKWVGLLQRVCYEWVIGGAYIDQQLRCVFGLVVIGNEALLHCNRGLEGMRVKNYFSLVCYSSEPEPIRTYNF